MADKEAFVTWLRSIISKILDGQGEANEALQHYLGLGYSDTANFDTADFVDAHPDIERADVLAAVGSLDALNTFLAGGHRTNLEKLRRVPG